MRAVVLLVAAMLTAMLPAVAQLQVPAAQLETAPTTYRCPMHPKITADEAGECPICGMTMVPVKSAGSAAQSHAAGGPAADNAINVASGIVQTLGVRSGRASLGTFDRTVRAFGRVAASTRLETVVASRVEGWIEHLAVTATGDAVRPGDLLYRVYSPDLVAAQQDFRIALRGEDAVRIRAAERRLRSLGMQEAVIDAVRAGGAVDEVPVYATAGGVVESLDVRPGAYVKPGRLLMRIQDYSVVWILADIAEPDLPDIAVGTAAALALHSVADSQRQGKVDYIYPTLNAKTHTGTARIVVDNSDGGLRPGGFADVSFAVKGPMRLSVPSEAVMRSAAGTHVILDLGEGRYQPRLVTAGRERDGRTEILDGLAANDKIVVSSQFLLGSEAHLREGFALLADDEESATTPESAPAAGHQHHRH